MADYSTSSQSSGSIGSSTPSAIQTPQSEWSQQLSQMLSALGQQQYNWAQQQFQNGMNITDANINNFVNLAGMGAGMAQNLLGRYQNVFEPLMNNFIQQAGSYNSADRQKFMMGQAESTAGQADQAALNESQRQLQSYGINPNSGRYEDLLTTGRLQDAATRAGAGTQASENTAAVGRQMEQTAAQMGQNVPAMTVNALNSAYSGLSGAENSLLGMLNAGTAMTSSAAPFMSAAANANKLPPVGNTQQSRSGSAGQSQGAEPPPKTDPNAAKPPVPNPGTPSQTGNNNGSTPQLQPNPYADNGTGNGDAGFGSGDPDDTTPSTPFLDLSNAWETAGGGGGFGSGDPNSTDTSQPYLNPDNAWELNGGSSGFGSGSPDNTTPSSAYVNPGNAFQNGTGIPPDAVQPQFDPGTSQDNSGSGSNSGDITGSIGNQSAPWDSGNTSTQFDPGTPQDMSQMGDNSGGDTSGGNSYQDPSYQDNSYQDPSYQDNSYQDNSYQDNSQQGGNYTAQGGGTYSGGNYTAPSDQSYDPGSSSDSGGYYASGGMVRGFAGGGGMGRGMGRGMIPMRRPGPRGPTTGGPVPRSASPTRGRQTDDVPARLNAGEFVIPRDVAQHFGTKHFQDLIAKSRKLRTGMAGPPARPQMKPILRARPTFQSRPMNSGVR